MITPITAKATSSDNPQYLWGDSVKSYVWMLEIRSGQELKSLHQVIAEDNDASALPFICDVLLSLGYRMQEYWAPTAGGYCVPVEDSGHPIPKWAGKFPRKPGTAPIVIPKNQGTATDWDGSNVKYTRVLLDDEWNNGVDAGRAHISIEQVDVCRAGEIRIGTPSLEVEVDAGMLSPDQARRIARAMDDAANLITEMQPSETRK